MKTKIFLTVILVLQVFLGMAQPGEIDITFNASGTGAFNGTSPTADCIVYKSKVYEDGDNKDKIIIVGRFNRFNGVNREYIARLNADGTLDTTFNGPDFGGGQYIYCLAIQPDGKIVIGGGFTITGTNVYQGIARLNEDGSLDTTFNAGTGTRGTASSSAVVHAITVQPDGKILFGGGFSTYNGVACKQNLTRLEANGTIDASFNSTPGYVNGEVRAIALQNTKIIVGGFFSGYSPGFTKNRILRLNSNGSYDPTFNSYTGTNIGATGGSSGLGVYDVFVMPTVASPPPGSLSEYIYVVGKFLKYNNVNKVSIARLTPDGLLDTSFTSGLTEEESATTEDPGWGYVAFAVRPQPDGKMLIGGNFRKYNGVSIPKGLVRVEANGTRDATFLTGTGFTGGTSVYQGKSVIRDILLQSDGRIVVGGDFTVYDGTPRRMLARIKTRECPYAATWDAISWKGGITPTLSHYMVVKNGTLTIPTGTHMEACELEIVAGRTLIIQPGASLTVNGVVMNNGTFTIENTGSLVQIKEETKNADLGAGTFAMKRNVSSLKGFDYVYWSSPVENQTLHNLSPNTRFDKYHKFNTSTNSWVNINNGTETMEEGKGYIIRAPSEYLTSTSYTYNATFYGRPHNGKILVPMVKSGTNTMNLIGNPYPSAIDAQAFLNDSENSTVLGTTIYLWSHQTGITTYDGGTTYGYANSDYIAYNNLGSVLTSPTATLFEGKVAAGQSFFAEAKVSGNVVFKNTMRLKQNNSQFYKNSGETKTNNNRLWIDLSNEQGAFKQILLGFTEDSSNGFDRNDGPSMNGNSYVDFYSLVENKKLVIQGRALPLDINQVIPIGYSAYAGGTFKIALHQYEGMFENQNVYLVDKLKDVIHDIKSGGYTFSTTAGTFDNRFEIRFTNGLLSNNQIAKTDDSIIIITENSAISLKSSETIDSVSVYDLTGKLLFNKKGIAAANFTTENLNVQQQMVMVQIKTINDSIINKKVMLN